MTAIPMHDHDHDHEHEHEHDHDHDHDHDSRNTTTQLWFRALLLIGLGVYFAYNIASGNIVNYVNARFAWLSYVAAALFLLIGAFSVWHLLADRRAAHGHEHHDHTHEPISWRVLAILAVPLVLGTLIPSKPLGAEAVSGGVSLTSAATTIGAVENYAINVPPEQRNVLDWLRAFNSGEYADFNGQPADVIGFVYTEPTFDANHFMVARFAISCCVADASAIGLPVLWDKTADLPQGEWIRVRGTFNLGSFNGDSVPVLQAASVEQVAQPEHPYLYP